MVLLFSHSVPLKYSYPLDIRFYDTNLPSYLNTENCNEIQSSLYTFLKFDSYTEWNGGANSLKCDQILA